MAIAWLISFLFLNVKRSIFFPSYKLNLDKIFLLSLFVKSEVKVQYSSGLNNSISFSLSVINFNATDWTLPADFDPGNFVQSIGDILKPTR